jgi:dUTP pyrophosphatase
MEKKVLKVKLLNGKAKAPHYSHEGDSGLDLYAAGEAVLQPGDSCLVPTGLSIQLPEGTEAQIRPRSGLAKDHQITVLNTPGTIDEGYRGEIGVILVNHGRRPFKVDHGMKIAQMVVKPVLRVDVELVEELEVSHRGAGGFGSTGTK